MKHVCCDPKISVIVPIYNIADYIDRCIKSIINQTYKNLEIILVDDGSTDCSGSICDKYAEIDKRVKIIHKKNGGLVSARKAGIIEATGVYATYVDGDDWIEENMYEKLQKQIVDADVIVSGTFRDYGKSTTCELHKIPDGVYSEKRRKILFSSMMYTGKFYERGLQGHVVNCLYERELLLKNQLQVPDEVSVGEDTACFYPLLLEARKVVLVSQCYYHYVIRENSIMGVKNGDELKRYKILYHYLTGRFAEYSEHRVDLMIQLKYMVLYTLLLKELALFQNKENLLFPYKNIKKGANVILCGKGRFGKEFKNYLEHSRMLNIKRWVDSNEINEADIHTINQDCDYIVVTVLIKEIADQIKRELQNMGIESRKIKCIDDEEIASAVGRIDEILK